MPKLEDLGPWELTPAASKDPYPRKNVNFIGDDMRLAYDYFIWRANIAGYQTLDGTPARGASEMIADLVKREYLRAMLDSREAASFERWRREQYAAASDTSKALQEAVPEERAKHRSDESRSKSLVRLNARSRRRNTEILQLYEKQSGKCASCSQERVLQVYDKSVATAGDDVKKTKRHGLPPNAVLLCAKCHRAFNMSTQHGANSPV